jgi:serine/threonine-protein kinase
VTGQNPTVNTAVPPNSPVTITVSTGKVKLPNVLGKKLADALSTLNQADFLNITQTATQPTTNQADDGTIAQEYPSHDGVYPTSTKISLTVYQYMPASPTCTSGAPSSPSGSPSDTGSPTDTGSPLPPCTS